MFLELLIVLLTQLTMVVGLTWAYVIFFGGFALAVIAVYLFSTWFINLIFGLKAGEQPRRDQMKGPGKKVLREHKNLDAMDLEQLERWVDRRANDKLARLKLAERYKESGNLAAYAGTRERYLEMETDLPASEICTYYHQLADLYLGPLNQPERARDMLLLYLGKHPRSVEAFHTRERVERINETLAARAAEGKLDRP